MPTTTHPPIAPVRNATPPPQPGAGSLARRNLASEALAKHLLGFSIIVLLGMAALVALPAVWPEPGDEPSTGIEIALQIVTTVSAAAVVALSFWRPQFTRRHAAGLTTLLSSTLLILLTPTFINTPNKTWPIAIAAMVMIVSGAVMPSLKWVLGPCLTAWAAFGAAPVVYAAGAAAAAAAVPWRTHTMILAVATASAIYVHRYVHTYITSFANVADRAAEAALTDALTGLPNRAGAHAAYAALEAAGHPISVTMLDVDGLKQINDAGGHAAGDQVILAAAEALTRCTAGSEATCARWGGDEFVIISPAGAAAVHNLQPRIDKELSRHQGISMSSGLPHPAKPGEPLDEVVQKADETMYQSKTARRAAAGDGSR